MASQSASSDVVGDVLCSMAAARDINTQQKDERSVERTSEKESSPGNSKTNPERRNADKTSSAVNSDIQDGGHKSRREGSTKSSSSSHHRHTSKSNRSSHRHSRSSSSNSSESKMEQTLKNINSKLEILAKGLANVTPIVSELKCAYDDAMNVEHSLNSDVEEEIDTEINLLDDEEPSRKRARLDDSSGPNDAIGKNTNDPGNKDGGQGIQDTTDDQCDLSNLANKPRRKGAKLNSNLANAVTDLLELGMEHSVRKEKQDSILVPENCTRLDVVQINDGIFSNLSKAARTDDVLLQKVQKSIISGLNVIVHLKNSLLDKEKLDCASVSNKLNDAIALIADGSHELDLRRQAILKDELKSEFKALARESNPVKELLFGDELEKAVDDLKKSNKVTLTLAAKKKPYGNYTNQSGNYQRNQNKGKWPFLGQCHKPNQSNYQKPYSSHYSQKRQKNWQNSQPQTKGRGKPYTR